MQTPYIPKRQTAVRPSEVAVDAMRNYTTESWFDIALSLRNIVSSWKESPLDLEKHEDDCKNIENEKVEMRLP